VITSLVLMVYLWWQHTPGMSELKRLCEKDAGDMIYKVVYADGYYDVNGRWDSLIKSGYQYIEFHQTKVEFSSVVKDLGYWRIYKSNKQDPLCDQQLEKEFDEYTNKYQLDFFKTQCLAARKLNKPESRYWLKNGIRTWFLDENHKVEMIEAYRSIDDVSSQYLLANSKYYRLLPYKKSSLDYALSFSCKDVGVELKTFHFPESILLPIQKGNKKK